MTTFEYDGQGRIIQAVTIRESEFSDWDRALLMSDRAKQRAPRGSHGLLLSETTDPDNQFAYKTKPPITDWAEKALRDAKKAYQKEWPSADMGALLWEVEPLLLTGEEELGAAED